MQNLACPFFICHSADIPQKQVNDEEVFLLNETVSIITDHDGRKIVLINDVRFKSRRSVVWNEVEKLYLYDFVRTKKETSKPLE